MIIFSALILTVYYLVLIKSLVKFFTTNKLDENFIYPVTILIPYRNEEDNIAKCLDAVLSLKLEKGSEIILINDHSKDASLDIVNQYADKYPFIKNISLNDKRTVGKKAALSAGINAAENEIIMVLDADSIVEKDGIKCLTSPFHKKNIQMVIAPVRFYGNKLFSIFNQLEWNAMFVLNFFNQPVVCSGTSIAYKKNIVQNLEDPFFANQFSGDDVFLMYNIIKKYKNGIAVINNRKIPVKTKAPENFKSFIFQKVRWLKKKSHFKNNNTIFIGSLILFVNFLFLSWLICFINTLSYKYLLFIALKCIIDFLLLILITYYYKQPKIAIWNIILIVFFYPFYLISILLTAPFLKIKWKGRTL